MKKLLFIFIIFSMQAAEQAPQDYRAVFHAPQPADKKASEALKALIQRSRSLLYGNESFLTEGVAFRPTAAQRRYER